MTQNEETLIKNGRFTKEGAKYAIALVSGSFALVVLLYLSSIVSNHG